jgi:hypothetical protein
MIYCMADSVPGRHSRLRRNRPYTVDGRDYSVSISPAGFDQDKNVRLRVSFRAQFGTRSVCLVRGLTNRCFWQDHPEIKEMRAASISITPRIVCGLIHLALREGWAPDASKSNFELSVNRDVIRMLAASASSSPEALDR